MFNLQAEKSRPALLEIKSGEAVEQTLYPSWVQPWILIQKIWTVHTRGFQAFSSATRAKHTLLSNWNSLVTTLLVRLEAVTERYKIEGDDKIKKTITIFHRTFMLRCCSIRHLRENMTLDMFWTGYSSCMKFGTLE